MGANNESNQPNTRSKMNTFNNTGIPTSILGLSSNHENDEEASSDCGGNAAREMEAFPVLLHRMLGEMEAEGNGHIISWNPDGKSFTIYQPKVFVDTIMPRWFKNQTRYKSFQVRTQ
jgi:hypothetical protein